jgi:hypothetical protein
MRLTVITSSTWIVGAAIDDRGRSPMRDELDFVLALLSRVSLTGPPRDERRSRHLGDGVFELKTPRGLRLIYFVGSRRTIGCGDLCSKPKPREQRHVTRRARDLREAYLAASASSDIVIEIGG